MTGRVAAAAVAAKVRRNLGAETLDVDLHPTPYSDSFTHQGVVRWRIDDDPEHRQQGVHNVNVRRDGGVELYWGAYDLSFDEALTVARRKFRNLGGLR